VHPEDRRRTQARETAREGGSGRSRTACGASACVAGGVRCTLAAVPPIDSPETTTAGARASARRPGLVGRAGYLPRFALRLRLIDRPRFRVAVARFVFDRFDTFRFVRFPRFAAIRVLLG
jgi:hypothetical protein